MRIGMRKAHTKASYGATSIYMDEYIESRKLYPEVVKLLQKYHTIVDCTPSEQIGSGEWNKGVSIANNSNLDLFFSLHFNSSSGDPQGTEVCVHPTDITAASYGNKICENMAKLSFRNRGVKNRSDLAETCNIKCASMVVEVCFLQKSDSELYKKVGIEKVARAIANAIDSRIPLEVEEAKNEEVKPTTQTQTKELYRVRLAWHNVQSQRGAYSNLDNAIAECKKHINYKVYDSQGKQVYPVIHTTKLIKSYKETGTATVVGAASMNVRNSYKLEDDDNIVARYYVGESFKYDSVYVVEYIGVQYVFCSYISYSGTRRYVCSREGSQRYLSCV